MTQGQFLSGVLQVLIQFYFSYSSCLIKAEETSLHYYLPIAGEIVIGFIPFPRVLVMCEMQSVSSRIWTRVAVSITYDDNHYTMGTSRILYKSGNMENAAMSLVIWYTRGFPVHKSGMYLMQML